MFENYLYLSEVILSLFFLRVVLFFLKCNINCKLSITNKLDIKKIKLNSGCRILMALFSRDTPGTKASDPWMMVGLEFINN